MKKKEKARPEQSRRVLVAMSGGVDSSVAAALLVKAGYQVSGAFMVNYDQNGCWHGDYQDAVRVAAKLNIPLLKLDFVKEYRKMVLSYLYKEYSLGRTPNPDVMCNKFVKFGAWLKVAKKLGFQKLATGHYANLEKVGSKYKLIMAKDENKDQTYFLHQLNQEQLKQVLFPLGNYLKSEVRSLARKFSLPTAEKEESMGICFVGEVPMKDFLQGKVKARPGKIISTSGKIIGEHQGLPFYTIGERGLNIGSSGQAYFVVDKNVRKNELVVGFVNDSKLFSTEAEIKKVNWLGGQMPKFPLKCQVRTRHRQELQSAECRMVKKKLLINFNKPQRALTPGQFAVFYKNGECLGGGEIK